MSPLGCSFFYSVFLARFIADASLTVLLFVFVLFVFFVVVAVLSGEPKQNYFIAGRPKAALLFWVFGDFRCDVSLFIVILVIYRYKK